MEYLVTHAHVFLLMLVLINQLLSDIPALKGNTIFTVYRGFVSGEAAKAKADLEKLIPQDAN